MKFSYNVGASFPARGGKVGNVTCAFKPNIISNLQTITQSQLLFVFRPPAWRGCLLSSINGQAEPLQVQHEVRLLALFHLIELESHLSYRNFNKKWNCYILHDFCWYRFSSTMKAGRIWFSLSMMIIPAFPCWSGLTNCNNVQDSSVVEFDSEN